MNHLLHSTACLSPQPTPPLPQRRRLRLGRGGIGLLGALLSLQYGCSAVDDGDRAVASSAANGPASPVQGGSNVSLGGSQDFGFFRKAVDSGQVPPVESLDAAGFFAEHHTAAPL